MEAREKEQRLRQCGGGGRECLIRPREISSK
jgi:hypothetical protein